MTITTTTTIYPLPGGAFGYEITSSAGHCIRQDFAPGIAGHPPMTEQEAADYAAAEVAQITAE